jgi:two-component system response regulator HydG
LTPAVLQRFMAYPWPGNIRELKSAPEYAFVVAERAKSISSIYQRLWRTSPPIVPARIHAAINPPKSRP